MRPKILLISPYAPETAREDITYARRAMRHSIEQGESPFAPHLLYTQPGVFPPGVPLNFEEHLDILQPWFSASNKIVLYMEPSHDLAALIRASVVQNFGDFEERSLGERAGLGDPGDGHQYERAPSEILERAIGKHKLVQFNEVRNPYPPSSPLHAQMRKAMEEQGSFQLTTGTGLTRQGHTVESLIHELD